MSTQRNVPAAHYRHVDDSFPLLTNFIK